MQPQKNNYISWLEIMVGLTDKEKAELEKLGIEASRYKYKMALLQKSDEMQNYEKGGKEKCLTKFYLKKQQNLKIN